MIYEDLFSLNSYRLICIIACFIIIFNNKLYPYYFGYKKYEKVSVIWLIFPLMLMLSSLTFFIIFLGSLPFLPIFMYIMTLHALKVDRSFRKRKKMSLSEFLYLPYLFITYAAYSYLFILFIINVLCRINAETYLFYIEDPFSFFMYGYGVFLLLFSSIFGLLNSVRIEKLFPDENFTAM